MLVLTNTQKKAMKELALCKVVRRKMWKKEHQLGYTSPGRRYYDINIASDTGNQDVEDIVLLHEVGHCYFGHNDIDITGEFRLVKQMCENEGVPFNTVMKYGGPMRFLNIAMDLEINSKLLTRGNIKTMKNFGFEVCTPENQKVETGESYRSYYIPLLRAAKEENFQFNSEQQNMTGDDLSNTCPMTGDSEIDDALIQEGYLEGAVKSQDGSNKVSTSTVGEEKKEIETETPNSKRGNAGTGSSTGSRINISMMENTSEVLERFLRSIVQKSLTYTPDSMRLWNRGTRDRSSGIIYNSYKQMPQKGKKKLGILVDISGSMDISSIKAASQSLKDCAKFLDNGSKFVTWNTGKGEEFPIMEIPNEIEVGGGTDMVRGINYLKDNGFTDIVIYSDFETNNLDTVDGRGYNLYSIVVGNPSYRRDEVERFLKRNKKFIVVGSH